MADLQVSAHSIGNANRSGWLTPLPDICPQCHHGMVPRNIHNAIRDPGSAVDIRWIECAFQCTRLECQSLFIAYYYFRGDRHSNGGERWELKFVRPREPQPITVDPEVEAVSPMFVKVYTQALASESYQLDQLTGIGLRKALEFLIKDYLIQEQPDKAEAIKKTVNLGTCIENFVSDTNIKTCAKRAAWLGNDETHYLRKWTDRDISDLKVLIKLTLHWTGSALLTTKYEREMPPKH